MVDLLVDLRAVCWAEHSVDCWVDLWADLQVVCWVGLWVDLPVASKADWRECTSVCWSVALLVGSWGLKAAWLEQR